jgi:hypothetical protein
MVKQSRDQPERNTAEWSDETNPIALKHISTLKTGRYGHFQG